MSQTYTLFNVMKQRSYLGTIHTLKQSRDCSCECVCVAEISMGGNNCLCKVGCERHHFTSVFRLPGVVLGCFWQQGENRIESFIVHLCGSSSLDQGESVPVYTAETL